MRLAVPLILQPRESMECGPACIEMVMKYHKQEADRKSILEDVLLLDGGVYTAQIGTYFLKKGFDVEMQALNPPVYLNNDKWLSQDQISAILNAYKPGEDHEESFAKSTIQNFMRNSGIFSAKLPTIKDIKAEIDAGNPIISNMTTRWYCGTPAKLNFHYNVITGYSSQFIFTNDPSGKFGGEKKYRHHEFLFSLYAISKDLGSGSLLKIRPKPKEKKAEGKLE